MGSIIIYGGIIAALAMVFLLLKTNLRRILGYDLAIDTSFTGLLAWMFAGTFSGMFAALIGGAIVSIFLYVSKIFIGAERYNFRKRQWIQTKKGFTTKL